MKTFIKMKSFFLATMLIILGFGIVLGSAIFINYTDKANGKTIATVTKIVASKEKVNTGNEELYTDVYTEYVSYEVDGVEYQNVEYGKCNKLVNVGDTMRIGYEIDQPSVPVHIGNSSIIAVRVCGWIVVFLGFINAIGYFTEEKENVVDSY